MMKILVNDSFRSMRRTFCGALGGLVVSFVGASMMTGACGGGDPAVESNCTAAGDNPPVEQSTACAEPEKPCMMYRIELLGDLMKPEVRAKYKAVFGSACYVAAKDNSFNCYFKTPQDACEKVMFVPKIVGAADYDDHPETCKNVPGTENWSLQTGSDPANVTYIYYEDAPVETSLIDVDGVPTEINGPYRNLPQLTTIKPGEGFQCKTGIPAPDGGTLSQREWILQVNRAANDGGLRSDLAGFTYTCKVCGRWTKCTEPEFLNEPPPPDAGYDPKAAEVHHEVRRTDLRGCKWGSNANGNAAVISSRLNKHLKNNYPLKEEVEQINKVPPYTYTP